MNQDINELEWVYSAKKALDWMIESMTVPEWHRRRKGVADYFHSLKKEHELTAELDTTLQDRVFSPIAVYSDWMAWYMYLVESIFERPGNDDPWQSNRVNPFFRLIGRYLDPIKQMPGIQARVKAMLNERSNQPDNTLYELAVAILYHRNGWTVEFLSEQRDLKMPDIQISKAGRKLWVECKRFAKVTDYAEKERLEWYKRWKHLMNAMKLIGIAVSVDVVLKVPVESLDEVAIAGAYWGYMKFNKIKIGDTFKNDQLELTVRPLDLDSINKKLKTNPTRPTSPEMIEVVTGTFDIHGNYTQCLEPSEIGVIAPDDDLYVLNEFYAGVREAYIVKWDCIAEESINRKFRDIKKRLNDAVNQIPSIGEGIVHIGYETVSGPAVEVKRHEKIQQTLWSYDFFDKRVEAVYCNALQLLSKPRGFEWAETTILFEKTPNTLLADTLLLDLPIHQARDSTHWEEDILYRSK